MDRYESKYIMNNSDKKYQLFVFTPKQVLMPVPQSGGSTLQEEAEDPNYKTHK